ncbi:hypothetical protein CBF23_000830 [Marinomonas agarivorans]|nr:hypothetical protein CBF23_000830 [Marinomonas agarivorans]
MGWMAWTPVTIGFFTTIAIILFGMTIYEMKSPCVERKGFLPIATTRGDRLFIGLLSSAYVHLLYVGLTQWLLIFPLLACLIWLMVIMRWG